MYKKTSKLRLSTLTPSDRAAAFAGLRRSLGTKLARARSIKEAEVLVQEDRVWRALLGEKVPDFDLCLVLGELTELAQHGDRVARQLFTCSSRAALDRMTRQFLAAFPNMVHSVKRRILAVEAPAELRSNEALWLQVTLAERLNEFLLYVLKRARWEGGEAFDATLQEMRLTTKDRLVRSIIL